MNVVDIINKAISERRTRFAFELLPPLKGDGCCGVFGSIDRLIGFDPAYINVTFHREGRSPREQSRRLVPELLDADPGRQAFGRGGFGLRGQLLHGGFGGGHGSSLKKWLLWWSF